MATGLSLTGDATVRSWPIAASHGMSRYKRGRRSPVASQAAGVATHTWRLAVATARPAADESIVPATFGNQPFQVEHRPALAGRTERRD